MTKGKTTIKVVKDEKRVPIIKQAKRSYTMSDNY